MKRCSVGADGVDPKGERRSPGGNPQTGPFYIEGAMPGTGSSSDSTVYVPEPCKSSVSVQIVGTQVSIAGRLPKTALARLRKAS